MRSGCGRRPGSVAWGLAPAAGSRGPCRAGPGAPAVAARPRTGPLTPARPGRRTPLHGSPPRGFSVEACSMSRIQRVQMLSETSVTHTSVTVSESAAVRRSARRCAAGTTRSTGSSARCTATRPAANVVRSWTQSWTIATSARPLATASSPRSGASSLSRRRRPWAASASAPRAGATTPRIAEGKHARARRRSCTGRPSMGSALFQTAPRGRVALEAVGEVAAARELWTRVLSDDGQFARLQGYPALEHLGDSYRSVLATRRSGSSRQTRSRWRGARSWRGGPTRASRPADIHRRGLEALLHRGHFAVVQARAGPSALIDRTASG